MMSQMDMSTSSSPPLEGSSTVTVFLETFAPRVTVYLSSNSSYTKRRIREVFPTAASPARQIFIFAFAGAMNSGRRVPRGAIKTSPLIIKEAIGGPPAARINYRRPLKGACLTTSCPSWRRAASSPSSTPWAPTTGSPTSW